MSAREPSPELIPESPPIVSPYAAAIHAKPLDIEPQKCSVCNETMDLLDSKADCASCDYLAHAKCLDLDKALEKVVSSRKDWRCADCKFCHECKECGVYYYIIFLYVIFILFFLLATLMKTIASLQCCLRLAGAPLCFLLLLLLLLLPSYLCIDYVLTLVKTNFSSSFLE